MLLLLTHYLSSQQSSIPTRQMADCRREFAAAKPYVNPKRKKALVKAICLRTFGVSSTELAKVAKRKRGKFPGGLTSDYGVLNIHYTDCRLRR